MVPVARFQLVHLIGRRGSEVKDACLLNKDSRASAHIYARRHSLAFEVAHQLVAGPIPTF